MAHIGGPWMIYNYYLSVRLWESRFKPQEATIDKVACWVRVSKVFLKYYDNEALANIGDRIGKTLTHPAN